MHTPRWSEVGEKAASPETFPLWKDLSILISRFSRLYKSTFTFASSIPLSRDQQTKLSLGCVAFKAFKAFSSVWHSSQSSAKGGEIHINRQHKNESNSNYSEKYFCHGNSAWMNIWKAYTVGPAVGLSLTLWIFLFAISSTSFWWTNCLKITRKFLVLAKVLS